MNRLPIILLTITVCVFQNACTSVGDPTPDVVVEDDYTPIHSESELLLQLESANSSANADEYYDFFKTWNRNVRPNKSEYIYQSNTIATLYDVFRAVYLPLALDKLGSWEVGTWLNGKSKYIVVQNQIEYQISENDSIAGRDDSSIVIRNFRPPVNIPDTMVLYLTSEYRNAVTTFLDADTLSMRDSASRYITLKQYITIIPGHWGGYWHVETHPAIYSIRLNKNLTRAKAYFRIGYEGGEALLVRTGNVWRITESNMTWIE